MAAVPLIAAFAAAAAPAVVTVHLTDGGVVLRDGDGSAGAPTAAATATFRDELLADGWGKLDVRTLPQRPGDEQMYAAGYAEGALTAARIDDVFGDLSAVMFGDAPPVARDAVLAWLDAQDVWTAAQARRRQQDPRWRLVSLLRRQLDGLADGYRNATRSARPLRRADFLMLSAAGDMGDIMGMLFGERSAAGAMGRLTAAGASTLRKLRLLGKRGHCSALVRATEGTGDLLFGHSTWMDYRIMNRVYKHYDFAALDDAAAPGAALSFSSYPGILVSVDDFYLVSSGLAMVQTSLDVVDAAAYADATPRALLAWQRVRLAHWLARDGRGWAEAFRADNSGTYNNQYMVVDLNRFRPGAALADGTLWVVEQMPGLVVAADETPRLRRDGFWPSYNLPFFPAIYNKSGMPAHFDVNPYSTAPRAQIFAARAGQVADAAGMRALMRDNSYRTDPLSGGDPTAAICARTDLPAGGGCADCDAPDTGGCIDSKVSSAGLWPAADAENGPTFRENGLPAFRFAGEWANMTHVGLPTQYAFDFVRMHPPSGSPLRRVGPGR